MGRRSFGQDDRLNDRAKSSANVQRVARSGPMVFDFEQERLRPSQLSRRNKSPWFAVHRIDKLQPVCQQLQRWIFIFDVFDIGIKTISDDRAPDRRHVDTNLMLLSAFRPDSEESQAFPCLDEFDAGNRVGRSVHDLLPVPGFACFEPVPHSPSIPFGGTDKVRYSEVFPVDLSLGKEPVVMRSRFRVETEEDHSGCLTVQTMGGDERGQTGPPLKANQEGTFDMVSGRRNDHPVRLVRNEDLVVAIQNGFFFPNARL